MIKQKPTHPHNYLNSFEKFNENKLAQKKHFR